MAYDSGSLSTPDIKVYSRNITGSAYMQGSRNMAYDFGSLSTPDIKIYYRALWIQEHGARLCLTGSLSVSRWLAQWLGVRPSDLEKFKIPEQCRLDMTDKDIEVGKQLLQEEFITQNPQWVKELEIMLSTKKKAEIQVRVVHISERNRVFSAVECLVKGLMAVSSPRLTIL
eukprot:8501222-Pyramimonas_sp.AAC.1